MEESLPRLVSDYGYLAVFIGTLLEGEAILMLAAYAAHQGYLALPLVIAIALLGATLGDQIFFLLGRRFGKLLLIRFPSLQTRAERVDRLLLRFHGGVIIGLRFAYGLRIAGPIAIGMSTLPAWRFFLFNAIGALIWAPLIAGAGYLFGHTLEWLLVDFKQYETIGFVVLIGIFVVVGAVSHAFGRDRDARSPPS
jgi:membrane protein DedA with SNARE-associated domain